MALIVQKFGGTSVATAERIKSAAKKAIKAKLEGNKVVVVVSARGDTTDELISLAHEISDDPPPREMDMLMATGEQISIALIAMAINALGHSAISFTGGQVGIITDGLYMRARIVNVSANRIKEELEKDKIVIVAGFQGVTEDQDITTLGRGGSDTTAVALAATMKADVCEIYTDVDGVYTADPRIVPEAKKIDLMSYDEMLELASLGATVLQSRSVEFAKKYDVPLRVKSSFTENEGTLVCEEVPGMEDIVVRGAAVNKGEAKITIRGVPDKPGQAARIFRDIAQHNVNVDMIVQNISEQGTTDVTFTVARTDLKNALEVTQRINNEIGGQGVISDDTIAKVSVVGVGMKSHSGVAERMFNALAEERINIQMISTSEIKISCVIDEDSADRALRAVHNAFGLNESNNLKE